MIRLDIREKPGIEVSDEKLFFSMVHAAFGQRRKTASNSISSGTGIPKAVVAEAIERCGFPPSVRAESMTAEQLAALCEALNELK